MRACEENRGSAGSFNGWSIGDLAAWLRGDRLSAVLARAVLVFGAAGSLGLVVLVALFKAGAASGIDILFYRGLVLCAVAFLAVTAGVAWAGKRTGLASLSDAIAAGCLSLGFNLAVLVILPVTVDRSISVFMLGYMAAGPGETYTPRDMEAAFQRIYLGDFQQIPRRLAEQERSGNLVRDGAGYRITAQGESFIRFSRRIGWLFDADPRLASQPARDTNQGGPAQAPARRPGTGGS